MRKMPLVLVVVLACLWGSAGAAELSPAEQAGLFSVYCAIGDSLTQGCQGMNVEENRQQLSYPAQLARAMDTEFRQPLITFPGCGMPNPEDWLKDDNIGAGTMIRSALFPRRVDRHYDDQDSLNNFAVTGATLGQILDWHHTALGPDRNAFVEMVGHISPWMTTTLGGHIKKRRDSAVDQALARKPTFVTVWIGNNDSFISTVAGTSKYCTPADTWSRQWNELVDRIKATPSIKGVALVTLPYPTAAAFLQPAGNPWHDVRCDLPEGCMVPFFATRTRSVNDVLTPEELAKIHRLVDSYNTDIRRTAAEEGWALADANAIFCRVVTEGMRLHHADGTPSDIVLTTDYATGGVFTLDGMHPTSPAYAYSANQIIRAINANYHTTLPLIDEVAVWQQDTLCQNPVDPRELADLDLLTMAYNLLGSPLTRDRSLQKPAKD